MSAGGDNLRQRQGSGVLGFATSPGAADGQATAPPYRRLGGCVPNVMVVVQVVVPRGRRATTDDIAVKRDTRGVSGGNPHTTLSTEPRLALGISARLSWPNHPGSRKRGSKGCW